MKKELLFCAMLCLMTDYALAYVTDAPHNPTNKVQCGDCHTYSLWWAYSPTSRGNPDYGRYTDTVCNTCHENKAGFPSKKGHTPASMEEMHNEDNAPWTTKCVDCHDPHQQAQLDWISDNATNADRIFLVKGRVCESGGVSPAADGNETTICFNPDSISYDDNEKWTTAADPEDINKLTWENKNLYSRRGLVFVHDTKLLTNTYSIKSVTKSTNPSINEIVLHGVPDSTIDDNATFGLMYGQLIKQFVDTPHSGKKAVKFFDPQHLYKPGGFVDDTPDNPQGICQVCHTKANYWLNDGSEINEDRAADLPEDHNKDGACTDCHEINLGFKPTYAEHDFISSITSTETTTCSSCHFDTDDSILDIHSRKCILCHPNRPPALFSSFSGKMDGIWPSYPEIAEGSCYVCHDSDGPGARDIKSKFVSHLNARNHTGQVNTSSTCAQSCHFHRNKDAITQVHSKDLSEKEHDPCTKCHNLTVNTVSSYSGSTILTLGSYSGPGSLIGSATGGAGDCIFCHGSVVNSDLHKKRNDHSTQVTFNNSDLCATCHDDENATGDVTVDYVHDMGGCPNCHYTANNYALKGSASNVGPGSCVQCHGPNFFAHSITSPKFTYDHDELMWLENPDNASCRGCHIETNIITGIHTVKIETLASELLCALCHNDQGELIGNASGHSEPTIQNPHTCATCHPDEADQDPEGREPHPANTDHTNMIVTASGCTKCHFGDLTIWVHNAEQASNCNQCHTSLTTAGISILQPAVLNAGGTCVTCHTSVRNYFKNDNNPANAKKKILTSTFYGHKNLGNHEGQVDGNNPDEPDVNCLGCHPGDDADLAGNLHYYRTVYDEDGNVTSQTVMSCGNCHDYDGNFFPIGSASGKETGKPPGNNHNYCTDCHIDSYYKSSNTHQNLVTP